MTRDAKLKDSVDRPSQRSADKALGPIPRGIEVLLKKAAVDPDFKQVLMSKRAKAADEIALKLEPAEIAMLNSVPAAQLETIIANTEVKDLPRSAFLGRAAAVMLAALGVSTQACSGPPVTGIAPDKPDKEPEPKKDEPQPPERIPAPEGIRPDRPVPKDSQPNSPESKPEQGGWPRGIQPDRVKTRAPSAEEGRKQVDAMVVLLGSSDLVERVEAKLALLELGPAALPALRQAKPSTPAAEKELKDIIKSLEAKATK